MLVVDLNGLLHNISWILPNSMQIITRCHIKLESIYSFVAGVCSENHRAGAQASGRNSFKRRLNSHRSRGKQQFAALIHRSQSAGVAEAYLGGPLGHGPPLAKKKFFWHWKKLENLVGPLLCMSTSGQRKFVPPLFEILNTPLRGSQWILVRAGFFSVFLLSYSVSFLFCNFFYLFYLGFT